MRLKLRQLRARLKPPKRRRSIAGAVAILALVALAIGLKNSSQPSIQSSDTSQALAAQVVQTAGPAPRPTEIVTFEQGCVSAECHAAYEADQGVHAPIHERDCAACHEGDAGEHTYPLLQIADALCADCHETGQIGRNRHEVLDHEGCLACHDAHESSAQFLLVHASVEETCEQCHPTNDGRSQHEPYEQGRCGACHEPHESDFAGLLRGGDGIEHCASCHEQISAITESSVYTHSVVEGGCFGCHAAHATNHAPLITSPVETQCVSCHEQVGESLGFPVTHDALLTEDKCLSCHDAHGSDRPKMLREDQVSLCLQCHNEPVVAADGRSVPDMTMTVTGENFMHGPVSASQCSACHSVHGSEYARLLREPAVVALTGSFDVTNYTLCFSCHDQELVLSTETTTATQFRDGNQNLHALHIQGENAGRTCTSCHAVHANDQPRHIAESIPYQGSDWLMPMGFKLSVEGGSCAPGCHEPLSYTRSRTNEQAGDSTGGDP